MTESVVTNDEDLYPTYHLFILSPKNPLRKACVAISTSKVFDFFIILTIATNCVIMGLNTPLPKDDMSNINNNLVLCENILLGIFCCEALLKIVSQGFIMHPNSYMRNNWNILDFAVVVAGIVVLFLNSKSVEWIKVIKAARVLRPLKFVAGIPSLHVVMSAILKSLASLLQIGLLIGFVIIIYAVMGLSFFMDSFHQSCYYISNGTIYQDGYLCGMNTSSGRHCPIGTKCRKKLIGQDSVLPNFDNILHACLTVFTCITCEGWTDVMYTTYLAFDYKARFIWMYFYSLNVIGSQFMLNLVCGVLSGQFSKENERVAYRTEFLRLRAIAAVERASVKYKNWIDNGEMVAVKELEEKLKSKEKFEMDAVVQTGTKLFLARNATFRAKLKAIMLSSFMEWLVIALVFLNSVSGAMQYDKQPNWMTVVENASDHVFLGFFFLEMCLKIYALGPALYFKSKFNIFDFVVIIASVLDWILKFFARINIGVSVFRQLKLMRLFRFTGYWPSLKHLVSSILASLTSIMSLLLLLFIFVLIFALLGMEFFGGELKEKNLRTNFDDFFNAMLAVFQIMTGEDWNSVMNNAILALATSSSVKGFAVSLYFVSVTCIGKYVLLNVFLAIAVANISLTANEKREIAEEEAANEKHMKEVHEKFAPENTKYHNADEGEQFGLETYSKDLNNEFDTYIAGSAKPGDNFLENLKNPGRMISLPQPYKPPMLQQKTLFIFEPSNLFRKFTHNLVTSLYFDDIMLLLIIVSSALLAFEDVTDPDATINKVLGYADYFFTSIFFLEVVVKVISYGFVLHSGSYCRDVWNCIDLFVVCCAVASIVLKILKNTSKVSQQVVQILRILRVFRPLKSINKVPKLKAVFQCMIFSLKNVFLVNILSLQFLLIFSIMGVQIFSGSFWFCTDDSVDKEEDCSGTYIFFDKDNYNLPSERKRVWKLFDFNFDNTLNAMLTLFTSSTGDAWYIHMQRGVDSTTNHHGPLKNNKIWLSIYFICFLIVFSFFFINVFVGMIIITFQEQGAAEAGQQLDRNAKNSLIFAMSSKPAERFMPEDVKSWQYAAWALIESNAWELTMTCLILLNTIALLIEYENEPPRYEWIMKQVNIVFSFIFVFEFVVKFFALGCNYFKDFWNDFDLIIMLGGLVDFCIKRIFSNADEVFDTSIFRLFRAMRLVKLLKRSRPLRILLWTFLKSFQALPYVGMLIFLLFFVYAIIGMQIFSRISITSKDEPWSLINENNHFRSYFSSTQVLFRIATGENWPNIMLACTGDAPCDQTMKSVEDGEQTCGTFLSYFYFISFIFFCSFLMLNLFIAVIMDNFAFLTEDSSILGPHHLDEVITVWSNFDPRASGRIKYTEVCELLRQILPPVGLGANCNKIVAYKRLISMNMTLYKDGTVEFTGTFFALVRTGLNYFTENANLKSNDQACRKALKEIFPRISKRTLDLAIPRTHKDARHMTIGKIFSAKLLWENYKMTRKRKQPMSIYPTYPLPFVSEA